MSERVNRPAGRGRSRRRARQWTAALVASVAVAACSGGGGGEGASPTTAPTTTESSTSTTIAGAPTSAVPSTAPAVTTGAGDDRIPVGVVWDYTKQEQFRPTLERLRGSRTWYELEWCQAQPDPGQPFNWDRADKNVGRARSVGITTMLRLRVGSCWATGGEVIDAGRGGLGYSVSAMPTDMAAYQAFVRSVVERYRDQGVTTYAIENEVNGEAFWRDSVEAYEQLVRAGAEAVRQADADATVLDSGLSSTAWGVALAEALLEEGRVDEAVQAYDGYYERRFARRAQDFPPAADEAELRTALDTEQSRRNRDLAAATFRLVEDGVVDALQLHFYERWTNVPALMSFLRQQLPAGAPIDVWEAGLFWPDFAGAEDEVAAETAQLVYLLLGQGASQVIFLPLQSNSASSGDEIRFGLVDADFQPRAGFEVVANLADFTRQGGVTWQEAVGRDGGRSVVASRSDGALGLVWSDGEPIALEAPEVTVSSLDGNTTSPATGVELTAQPLVATASSAPALTALVGA